VGAPSTSWHESADEAEAQRHQAFAKQLTAIQSSVDRTAGPGRALHRKQVLGLSARLEVLADIPAHARAGLFAQPAAFDGVARLSNGAMAPQPDDTPDIRGFALSVRGVAGEGALGGRTDRQDFLLINRPTFGFTDSRQFAAIVPALAQGKAAFMAAMVETFGAVRAPVEAARLTKELFRPFSGFATETFFSAAPIRWGEHAAKVRLMPDQRSRRVAPPTDLAGDMADRLREGPVTYALQAQFFVSEEVTPIENGRVDWPEEVAEFVTVARVVLPRQDPGSSAGVELGVRVEQDAFDPWAALAEHRPLGEIMRARKVAYYASQRHRHATGS